MLDIGDPNHVGAANEYDTVENPFNDEQILDLIFNNLPRKDWKSARLVQKTWNSTLQNRWRDQMLFRLGFVNDYSNYLPGDPYAAIKFLEQQHPANSPNDPLHLRRHPVRNVHVRWCWDNDYILFQPDQIRFWELYGHGLKCIHFESVRIHKGALLKRLLFELTPNLEKFTYLQCVCEDIEILKPELNTIKKYTLPATVQTNLKYFKVDTVTNRIKYESQFPISWIEFFSTFPNIQNLQPEIDPQEIQGPSNFLKLFQAIDIVRKANNNQVLNISELRTQNVGFAHVDLIKNQSLFASLPISILCLNADYMTDDEIIFLVQSFEPTLRDFAIDKMEKGYLPSDMLPQGLTRLSVLGGRIFRSLEFLVNTPNLEELKLTYLTPMLNSDICNLAAVSPLVKVKKLTYMLRSKELSDDSIPFENMLILAKLMPNVKICDADVDADAFQALCIGWPELEHLDLFFLFLDEDVLLEHLVKLKHLRSLIMYCHADFKFTDKSIYEGFLKLPSLTKIQLPRADSSVMENVTEQGFQALLNANFETIWHEVGMGMCE